jgi:hypothetical protein
MSSLLLFLGKALGGYVRETVMLGLTFLECQMSISLFTVDLQKRRNFPLFAFLMTMEGLGVVLLLAIWKTEVNTLPVRILCYLALSFYNVIFLFVCWDDSKEELLMAFSSGTAAYQIGNKLFPLIQNFLGINDQETVSLFSRTNATDVDWFIFFAFRIGTYLALMLIFRPRVRLIAGRNTRRSVILLSVFTVAFVNILTCIARVYESESFAMNMVVKVFVILFSFVVLMLGRGIFSESRHAREKSVLRELRKQDQLQFETVKASMDMVNMKCHDLRHIFNKIEDKLTEEEASTLKEAMTFYDASIKTGNDVMDIVLCEKKVLCEKNGIRFSCDANGKGFSFLSATETYSLFGNIIDNAIEAVKKLQDEEKKMILLYCGEEDGKLSIEEMNYYEGELQMIDGVPTTTKPDAARHGYGTKSIRYITEQHKGTVDIGLKDGMFSMKLTFPPAAA